MPLKKEFFVPMGKVEKKKKDPISPGVLFAIA